MLRFCPLQEIYCGAGATGAGPSSAANTSGVFDAYGVTAQQIKPVVGVGDLVAQHLDALEAEAEQKGGIAQLLHDHFQKLYKVSAPLAQFHDD